jgi:hypothetical protein
MSNGFITIPESPLPIRKTGGQKFRNLVRRIVERR